MVVTTLIVAANMLDTTLLRLSLAIEMHSWLGNCDGRNEVLVPSTFKKWQWAVADSANPIGLVSFDEFGTLFPNCLINSITLTPAVGSVAFMTYPACSSIEC